MSQDGAARAQMLEQAFACHRQGRQAEAASLCAALLRQWPGDFHALHLLGVMALQAGRTLEGVTLLERAIAIDGGSAHALVNLGNGYRDLKRPREALECYDRAIALMPALAEAHGNRGNALIALHRPLAALESYDRAIALKPDFAEAHGNRARALIDLKRPDEALASCDRALALNPRLAGAWGNRGLVLGKTRRHAEAADAYGRLLAIDPGHPFIKGMMLFQKMQACAWDGVETLIAEIAQDIAAGRPAADPFGWQGAARSPQSLKRCAEQFCARRFPAIPRRYPAPPPRDNGKIRIGYVSGEFREHATALLMAGVLEHHDAAAFEIFAFDNGWDDGSATRRRIAGAVHRLIDISGLDDDAAADAIQAGGIDILVNLNGYFGGDRMLVFARRPAPIQVSYLGFPGTLGAPYMDYLIADRTVIPQSEQGFYTEQIVYLPHCYQANDDRKEIGGPVSRAQCGLPEQGFVFCCFNNNYKLLPFVFDAWMRILRRVEGSVLWLLKDNDAAAANLRRQAGARGVDPARLVFAARAPLAEHLARHRCAGLFLDTLPYNAHTTASDALWAGLPVLTCRGTTFPGRVAASLLAAIGLDELIAPDMVEYERLAVALAEDPARLAALKARLETNRRAAPLFDTAGFTRDLEAAYRAIHARQSLGLAPAAIATGSPEYQLST